MADLFNHGPSEINKDGINHVTLRVKKLGYSITSPKARKWWQKFQKSEDELDAEKETVRILNDISFTVTGGQLVAIMGGSGSGKTSLLDVLTCRNTTGTVTGDVYLNSVVRTKAILDSCAGYVKQEDRLIAHLTVKETLTFVASLKLPRDTRPTSVEDRVDQVLDELGLKHVADTNVGDELIRGISGGERRRVSIGIQLLLLPSLLFLDEPTTGLDSFTAVNLVQTLSKLTSRKMTIIMSIHQPRYDIFNMVDMAMILSKGSLVYNGLSQDMVSYFTKLNLPCPPMCNPSDFYIDISTVDSTSPEKEEKTSKRVKYLHEAYATHVKYATQQLEDEQLSVNSGDEATPSVVKDDVSKGQLNVLDVPLRAWASPSLPGQTWVICKRFLRVTIDNTSLLLIHVIEATMMSALLGTAFYQLKLTQTSIRDWFALMYIMNTIYPYMVILGAIKACYYERNFLYFELQDKLYRPTAYYLAKIISGIPFHMLYTLFYCLPLYAMAGLYWDVYTFSMFYLFVTLSVYASRSMAMMMAFLLPTYHSGNVVAQTMFSLVTMGAGFYFNLDNMLDATKWLSQISYIRWNFQALSILQIDDLKFQPGLNDTTITGKEAMELFGLDGGELWICALRLIGTIFFFLTIMYLGLRLRPQKPENV